MQTTTHTEMSFIRAGEPVQISGKERHHHSGTRAVRAGLSICFCLTCSVCSRELGSRGSAVVESQGPAGVVWLGNQCRRAGPRQCCSPRPGAMPLGPQPQISVSGSRCGLGGTGGLQYGASSHLRQRHHAERWWLCTSTLAIFSALASVSRGVSFCSSVDFEVSRVGAWSTQDSGTSVCVEKPGTASAVPGTVRSDPPGKGQAHLSTNPAHSQKNLT